MARNPSVKTSQPTPSAAELRPDAWERFAAMTKKVMSPRPALASLRVEPSLLEEIAHMRRDAFLKLVRSIFETRGGNFMAVADSPVIGTKHAVMCFRFVPELFNKELRAALRAEGV